MEYRSFDEIELPVGAVTETNPAHRMAYRRYSSDQVVAFHDAQVKILRAHSPGKFVTHNFIPMNETGVDNHALAADLDFAAYDNYPLGRTDLLMAGDGAEAFRPYMRTGHPDFGTFFFDQTRAWRLLDHGAAARAGELGQPQSAPGAGHGAAVDPGSLRPRGWRGQLFPLASGAVRPGADARGPAAPG